MKFDFSGNLIVAWAIPPEPILGPPFVRGVAVDVAGDVYAVDFAGYVHKFDGSGKPILTWTVPFESSSIATDSACNVYVTDPSNYLVHKYDRSGNLKSELGFERIW